MVAAGDFVHLLLNRLEVAFADWLHREIVVEATVDGGADGRLGVGVERCDRLGQQVGGRVAADVHARVAVPSDAGDVAVLMERGGQVALDAVDGGRHAAVLATEGVGDDFTCGDAGRVLVDGAVGQRDVDHRHGTPRLRGRARPLEPSVAERLTTRYRRRPRGPRSVERQGRPLGPEREVHGLPHA